MDKMPNPVWFLQMIKLSIRIDLEELVHVLWQIYREMHITIFAFLSNYKEIQSLIVLTSFITFSIHWFTNMHNFNIPALF